ncbi:hypothetical protein Ctob_015409 [Chrysochromulina tobinii]|uniref:Uncharacterized protein n=1 Tax=Chrysochromulina tobinii TaxID=1460289 RepID=A0A0M0K9R9_9EUKA|nr:hypothetical protein Ctob_015409 [Chrysochromulina tobinii]|eukprot:KOO35560.1 hypothetical protein Ctob_015409 [Chrysochromulina sp. CCMP291]
MRSPARWQAGPQVVLHQEEARKEAEPEPPDPAVDPHAHRQQDPVQHEAPPLAPHEDWPVDARAIGGNARDTLFVQLTCHTSVAAPRLCRRAQLRFAVTRVVSSHLRIP